MTIGITGGIGSGKSILSHILKAMNYPVYIADDMSKQLTNTNPGIINDLTSLFGENIYENGILNKKMLATEIFTDKEKLTKVNNIIHPAVINDFLQWQNTQTSPIIFIETAILFETNLHKYVNKSILIISPIELRIKRLLKRDNSTKESIENRIKNQMQDEEKAKLADFIIENDEKKAILPQLHRILEKL